MPLTTKSCNYFQSLVSKNEKSGPNKLCVIDPENKINGVMVTKAPKNREYKEYLVKIIEQFSSSQINVHNLLSAKM